MLCIVELEESPPPELNEIMTILRDIESYLTESHRKDTVLRLGCIADHM